MPANWPTAAGLGGLSNSTAIAVDPQSNVWAPNNTGLTSLSEISISTSALAPYTTDNFITEVVGAAAPVYQPFSKGLSNGRFQNIP